MLKQDGKWLEVEWQTALEYVANGLRQITGSEGVDQIAALATPHSTVEELYLLQKLMRGIGSNNIDFRLRQSDFSSDGKQAEKHPHPNSPLAPLSPSKGEGTTASSDGGEPSQFLPWLGMTVAEINTRDRFLIVGSFLRKDHPLLAYRVRQAVKHGAQANIVHSSDDDLLMHVANKSIIAPDQLVNVLAQILKALSAEKSVVLSSEMQRAIEAVQPSEQTKGIARSLATGERAAVLLGNFAQQHPQAVQIAMLAEQIAILGGAKFGFLGEASNSVGAYLAGAVPFGNGKQGMNAAQMLASPRKAYVLLNVEPELDMHDPQRAMTAMQAADMVVALSAYKHRATEYADVLLPIAPFTETSGTFVNTEGLAQSFKGAVKPLGEARPAWKVLRVLGNLLNVSGFDYDASEAVRDEVLPKATDLAYKLNNHIPAVALQVATSGSNQGLQRVSDVPIYLADAVVRRATALQETRDAATPCVALHSSELHKLGLNSGDTVKVSQGDGSVRLTVQANDRLAMRTARVAAGHPLTEQLGAMFGEISVEPIEITTGHSTRLPKDGSQVAGQTGERA